MTKVNLKGEITPLEDKGDKELHHMADSHLADLLGVEIEQEKAWYEIGVQQCLIMLSIHVIIAKCIYDQEA